MRWFTFPMKQPQVADIAQREHLTIDQLCTEIDPVAGEKTLTSAIRVFINSYMVRLARQSADQRQRPIAVIAIGQNETQRVNE